MSQQPDLLFDAGGVLVFPNFERLAKLGAQAGIPTTAQELAAQHTRMFHDFDAYVAQHRQFPKIDYFYDLFHRVTPSAEKAQAARQIAQKASQEEHLWATTQPWVSASLSKLKKQGFQMAVISNSEGSVEQILQDLDLRKFFEIVIDSHVVGVEKPDPQIFEIALERLGWNRTEALYVGDIFYVDVWGANQAGLGAVHLDKMDLYKDWGGIHLSSIRELPKFFADSNGNFQDLDLFPAHDFKIRGFN